MTKRTPSTIKTEVDSANAMPDTPRQSSVFSLLHLPSSGSTVMDGDIPMSGTLPDLYPGPIDTGLNGATTFSSQASGSSVISSPITSTSQSTLSGFNGTSHERAASMTAEADGLDVTGRGVKDLVQAIDRLRQLGVETSNIPLPKIVVVGDQSAGKSSLIEAISEIKVPRSSGTCTRCPLEIALTADEQPGASWVCNVYLHKRYEYDVEKFPFQETSPHDYPFKPWTESNQPVNEHFATLRSKESLEEVIRRAQFAILNPSMDSKRFISGPIPMGGSHQKPEVEFSPNLIYLEISGPGLPNLSFYDLPGIINQTEDSTQPWLVKIVKNLVKLYIRPENALVLLACSMEVDVHTSSAAKIVRSMGAEKRCIGVLTKPDRLPSGEHLELWRSILNGEKFRLGHTYYVTKQPSQADLDRQINHAQARVKEKAFFELQEPWATKFAAFRNRFGTPQLQIALSQKLAAQILDSLPDIRFQVHQRMNQIEHELGELPEPPTTDASRIVLEVLQVLCMRISKYMDGEHPYNSFRLGWKGHQQEFCQSITSMRPTLIVKTSADIAKSHAIKVKAIQANANVTPTKREMPSDTISLDTDSECGTPCPVPYSVPSKKQKVAATPSPQKQKLPQRPNPSQRNELAKQLTLDTIRQVLEDFSASGRPGEIDPKAVDHLILQCLTHWDKPSSTFLEQTEQALRAALMATMADVLSKWKTTELYRETQKIVEGFLSVHMGHQRDNVAATALQLERAKPITYNEDVLEEYRRKELQRFQDARYESRANLYFEEMQVNTGKQISPQERMRKIKTDENLKSTLGSDPFQREIEVMAKVRAYYNVAAMRFVDVICQNLQLVLFGHFRSQEQFRSNLHTELEMGLRIHGEDGMPPAQEQCMRLLAEDPAREVLRSNLKRERDALNAAQVCLDELSLKYQEGGSRGVSLSDGTMS